MLPVPPYLGINGFWLGFFYVFFREFFKYSCVKFTYFTWLARLVSQVVWTLISRDTSNVTLQIFCTKNKINKKSGLQGVESPRGASLDKLLLVCTPSKRRIPTGSFICRITTLSVLLSSTEQSLPSDAWFYSGVNDYMGGMQIMNSGRPVSQILQCPDPLWCRFSLRLRIYRREGEF